MYLIPFGFRYVGKVLNLTSVMELPYPGRAGKKEIELFIPSVLITFLKFERTRHLRECRSTTMHY